MLFAFWLKRLFFRRVKGIGKIFMIGHPKSFVKVIESTNTRSAAHSKAGNNGMKRILFEVSSKSGVGSYFEFDRDKKSPEHIGRESWFRSQDGITVLHKGIHFRQIKRPKFLKDLPGGIR